MEKTKIYNKPGICKVHKLEKLEYAKMYEGDEGYHCPVCSKILTSRRHISNIRKSGIERIQELRNKIKQEKENMNNDITAEKCFIEILKNDAAGYYMREVSRRQKEVKQ